MLRSATLIAVTLGLGGVPLSACAQEAQEWDEARANLVANGPSRMAQEIDRWEELRADTDAALPFARYASFLTANPGFPDEASLRARAEERLRGEFVASDELLGFFDQFPPATNFSRAHYALALMGRDRETALELALQAWRGGEMSEVSEATISSMFGQQITQADHDARMDALLWQREREAAERQLRSVSAQRRAVFAARLAILQGGDGAIDDATALTDPGYLFNRTRELMQDGRRSQAVSLLAGRAALTSLPFDQTAWVTQLLAVARRGSAAQAQAIAGNIDDGFAPGQDVSLGEYRLRDDYTSLMWLGGTSALWERGDAAGAAPIFYRYGAAARTPQTRSKGFYWAGFASARAGLEEEAVRYYDMAAAYPDRFYGMLALEALGRTRPTDVAIADVEPTPEERAAFLSQPLTMAVAEVAREAPWSTGIRFYREIAGQAQSISDHLLVAELARDIGRRDLAVNLADAAMAHGHDGFTLIGHPLLDTPAGTNFTMIHAVARQESQFAENAVSHAGARGLMQFMPATARMEARHAGVPFSASRLIEDPDYSMQLGSNHIERLIRTYDGSYPLAVAAYNAGPGNVNRWLRENGDPRNGSISWTEWIERIGFFETKNYVQRVLENAVVYETLYPEEAGRSRDLSAFLR